VRYISLFLVAPLNHHNLLPRTRDLGGRTALTLFDLKVGQVELLSAGYSAANGGLDLLDLVAL
jgi:hypothetical protein